MISCASCGCCLRLGYCKRGRATRGWSIWERISSQKTKLSDDLLSSGLVGSKRHSNHTPEVERGLHDQVATVRRMNQDSVNGLGLFLSKRIRI